MDVEIIITPVNRDIRILGESLWLLNEFQRKGFYARKDFINKVVSVDKRFDTIESLRKLDHFWLMRCKDELFIDDLKNVLKQI